MSLLAQSRHKLVHCTCLLLGVKRTSFPQRRMSVFDPRPGRFFSGAESITMSAIGYTPLNTNAPCV